MRRRTRRRPRNPSSGLDKTRYDRAVLDMLQAMHGKASRTAVIEQLVYLLELEEVDEDHRRKTDTARARLVDQGYIYAVDQGEKGVWELTPAGWDV